MNDERLGQAALVPYGWDAAWAARFDASDHEGGEPARVVRHDGAGLIVATAEGVQAAPLVERVEPPPTVGDWIVLREGRPAAVLDRTSLLRRRDDRTDSQQVLAANVDLVLIVCGLDRPVKQGRIQRGVALAREAGAEPGVVLTKAHRPGATADIAEAVALAEAAQPGIDVVVTSAKEGIGLEDLESLIAGRTVVLLGESGAGKSSIVNALLGDDTAAEGRVRTGDSKGRHTTTNRSLYVLPTGGTLIDTPGIRSIGLWVDEDSRAVAETFADIDELAAGCRFNDCAHETEPGCAVNAAVAAGELDEDRLMRWRLLEAEAEAAAVRASPHERRRYEKKLAKLVNEAQRRKGSP
ncbi:MAG: ribosome small subunit-dependent GTPase A [Acidimicrobiales bacterium]|nr:ribosome small subunit-dependent GTPase A [Acidimicrobiales bacterium]